MGRPATRPVKLREGFYIEIMQKGDQKGIKIRRDTFQQIQQAINMYDSFYQVKYLGRLEKGVFHEK